ncbi:MAG TPA: hypothetical protein VFJ19_01640 [Nocardioidaceae bacterium]|nr:hypothetical protein [Nocardioidaceae bacterium]
MSTASDRQRILDGLSRLSRVQLLLRACLPATTVLMLVLVRVAGSELSTLYAVVVLLVSLAAAALPDSSAPFFLVVALAALWVVSVDEQSDRLDVFVLLAGWDLLVLHVAATLAGYGPPGTVVGRVLALRWAGRLGLMAAAATAVWLAARAASGLGLPSAGWVAAVALGVVLAWVGYLAVRLRDPDTADAD